MKNHQAEIPLRRRRSSSNAEEAPSLELYTSGLSFTPATEKLLKLSEVIEGIDKKKSVPLTSVALAYVMHKTPYVHPMVGGRSVKHLKESIEALGLELADEDIEENESAVPFDLGFPYNFAAHSKIEDRSGAISGGDVWLTKMFGYFDFVLQQKPIQNGLHEADLKSKDE